MRTIFSQQQTKPNINQTLINRLLKLEQEEIPSSFESFNETSTPLMVEPNHFQTPFFAMEESKDTPFEMADFVPNTQNSDTKLYQLAKKIVLTSDDTFSYLIPPKLGKITSEKDDFMSHKLRSILSEEGFGKNPDSATLGKIKEEVMGLGPLQSLYEDDSVTQIMINSPTQIYIQANNNTILSDKKFINEDHLSFTIKKLIHFLPQKNFKESTAISDVLPDGSHFYLMTKKLNQAGFVAILTKKQSTKYSIEDLTSLGVMDHHIAHFLKVCVQHKIPMWICGSIGTGKATLLNALSQLITKDERIAVIDPFSRINLANGQHHVALRAEADEMVAKFFSQLSSLRATRLLIPDIRSKWVYSLIECMNQGMDGTMLSMVSQNAITLLNSTILSLLSEKTNISEVFAKEMIMAISPIIIECGINAKKDFKIKSIKEIQAIENNQIILQDIFKYEQKPASSRGSSSGEGQFVLVSKLARNVFDK